VRASLGLFNLSTAMKENISQDRIPLSSASLSLPHASLRSAAGEYLARGWPIVPLFGKLPAIPAWKEF